MLRRSFLSRATQTAAVFGIGSRGPAAATQAAAADSVWRPARHQQDDWFDQIPGRHRFFFDTLTWQKVGEAATFATNYLDANKSDYALEDRDLAVVIGLRHRATPFAFNDAMWAKYGRQFSDILDFTDPKTKQPPATNLYPHLAALVKRGVHLAVCNMATHAYSRRISEATDGDPEAIYHDLTSNTIGSAHFVAAGILAVNRAQERGYSIAHIG